MIIATFMAYTFLSVATLQPTASYSVPLACKVQCGVNVQSSPNVVQKPTHGPLQAVPYALQPASNLNTLDSKSVLVVHNGGK